MKETIRASGIIQDVNAAELNLEVWNEGVNVVFENGFPGAAPGWIEHAPGLICKPLWTLPVDTPTLFYWIYAGNNDADTAGVIGVTDGTNHFDITPVGGISVTNAGDWTGGVLNGIPVLNNPLDTPLFWDLDTGNPCQELPGFPANTLCGALRPFKFHLVAMNIEDSVGVFPDLVIWSAAANPGAIPQEWDPTPANEAGSFTISETAGGIIDGGTMRDSFMIYKTHSSSTMTYIAGQFVFSNRKAFVTSGVLARNCYAEMYGQHYVITDGDVIRHNGQEVTSLIDGRLRDFLFEQIDPDTYTSSCIVARHSKKEIWVLFPKSGHLYPDTALVYDIRSESWGIVDLPDTPYMTRGVIDEPGKTFDWDSQTDTWDERQDKWNQRSFNPTTDQLLFLDHDNKKLFAFEGFLRDGAAVPLFLQMLSKDFGDPQRVKLVTALWPQISSQASGAGRAMVLRVGTQMEVDEPIAWSSPFAIQPEEFKADFLKAGRYLSFELAGDQTAAWRLNSLDVDYEDQGMW